MVQRVARKIPNNHLHAEQTRRALMLLRYAGEIAAADRIDRALAAVLGEQRHVTRDLGGNSGTREMTAAIIAQLT